MLEKKLEKHEGELWTSYIARNLKENGLIANNLFVYAPSLSEDGAVTYRLPIHRRVTKEDLNIYDNDISDDFDENIHIADLWFANNINENQRDVAYVEPVVKFGNKNLQNVDNEGLFIYGGLLPLNDLYDCLFENDQIRYNGNQHFGSNFVFGGPLNKFGLSGTADAKEFSNALMDYVASPALALDGAQMLFGINEFQKYRENEILRGRRGNCIERAKLVQKINHYAKPGSERLRLE